MFIVIFCCLVILFLVISNLLGKVIAPFLILLGVFCDEFFTNKILRCSGYVINIILVIVVVTFSIVLAYKLTPEILKYIK